MFRKLFITLLIVVAGLFAVVRFTHRPEPLPPELESSRWLQRGIHEVSFFDVELTDNSRVTQANGDFPGSDNRRLQTRIWYPKGVVVAAPLVIYSHGFMSSRYGGSYLAAQLASHGYIVAAMDYPLTTTFAPGGPLVSDVVNQPEDISFLIDQFLSWNAEPDHQFYQAIDEHRIGAIGLSLGGMTSTLVAFHPTIGDPRIAAAVSIAGPSFPFGAGFYRHRSVPYLMIASPIDPMVTYPKNAAGIPEVVPGSVLVTMDKASHTGFDAMGSLLRWLPNPDSLGCYQVVRGLEKTKNMRWLRELGTEAQGIVDAEQPGLCAEETLPPAMNPIRQHWLTSIAVYSFLESLFSLDELERRSAKRFLLETMPAELNDIHVRAASR